MTVWLFDGGSGQGLSASLANQNVASVVEALIWFVAAARSEPKHRWTSPSFHAGRSEHLIPSPLSCVEDCTYHHRSKMLARMDVTCIMAFVELYSNFLFEGQTVKQFPKQTACRPRNNQPWIWLMNPETADCYLL